MKSLFGFFRKYSFLLGIFLFVFLLSRLDFTYYRELILRISLPRIVFILLIFAPVLFIRTYRWQVLMKRQGIDYSFWQSFKMYQASSYLGMFTPGRIGEAVRVLYLARSHSLGKSFVSIFLDRLADVVFLAVFGYLGIFLFFSSHWQKVLFFSAAAAALALSAILLFRSFFMKMFFKKIFNHFMPQKYQNLWSSGFQEFFNEMRVYQPADFVVAFFLTAVLWFLYYAAVYLFALDIGISQIPFFYFSASLALAALITLLPISISGLGTREAVLLTAFSSLGVSAESVIAISMFAFSLLILGSLVGLFCWLKQPL